MKGVHKKDGGEKSRQTWRKTVREKERKEEGGKRNAWKMDRKTEKRGKADLEKEREKERWRRKGKHREKKKRPGEKKTEMEEERRMEKRDGDAGKRPSGRINAAMVHGAGERRIETEGERDGMNFVG